MQVACELLQWYFACTISNLLWVSPIQFPHPSIVFLLTFRAAPRPTGLTLSCLVTQQLWFQLCSTEGPQDVLPIRGILAPSILSMAGPQCSTSLQMLQNSVHHEKGWLVILILGGENGTLVVMLLMLGHPSTIQWKSAQHISVLVAAPNPWGCCRDDFVGSSVGVGKLIVTRARSPAEAVAPDDQDWPPCHLGTLYLSHRFPEHMPGGLVPLSAPDSIDRYESLSWTPAPSSACIWCSDRASG